jgi:membrane-bound lytic murein transglycosylase D
MLTPPPRNRFIGAAWMCIGLLALTGGGCSHTGDRPPRAPSLPTVKSNNDLVLDTIAAAEAQLAAGLAKASAGDAEQARAAFDRAIDVYMTAPPNILSDARLAKAYGRTIEQIHLREVEMRLGAEVVSETPREATANDGVAPMSVDRTATSSTARELAEAAVRAKVSDFPVEANDAVLDCIELYRGPLRDWYAAALARGASLLPFIRQVMASEGLPQDLAYVALVESAFKATALSRARARGVWQFIPATGQRFGLQQDWWVDERSHPEKATRAAARYLKELLGQLGNWNLALAAYNAGERNLLKAAERYGTSDFWQLRNNGALPRETANYVPMIHAAIIVAKAPRDYGIEVPSEQELPFEYVPLREPVDLRTLAECAGCTLEQVRTLNPELRRMSTPVGRAFDVRVPRGTGLTALACLRALPPEKRLTFRRHVVARGQTLASIARRYHARASDIAEANGLTPRRRLSAGTELLIPIAADHWSNPSQVRVRSRNPASGSAVRHRVRSGETLATIAAHYRTTVRAIERRNGLRNSRIVAGTELIIFPAK